MSRSLGATRRSIFGFVRVYKLLPAEIVESSFSISVFQRGLQELLLSRATVGCAGRARTFCPDPYARAPVAIEVPRRRAAPKLCTPFWGSSTVLLWR